MKYTDFIEELKQKGSVPGLDSIKRLLAELGDPQEKLKIIHIAGTNGKGSIFAYLSSILQSAGYKVGRYISPTIVCYEERFQINGRYIDKESLADLYDRVESAVRVIEKRGEVGPTLFEAETAIAFLYFLEKGVDYALIECGMGGREDATNVMKKPAMSVIASISYDHMAILGDTLTEIAGQKAGIIKEACPVILSANPLEVRDVIEQEAREKHSPLYRYEEEDYELVEARYDGMHFRYHGMDYETSLPGTVQIQNAMTALLAAEVLGIDQKARQEGIRLTRWPGRLELLSKEPLVYRDGAHNPDAAFRLAEFLQGQFDGRKIIYCMGILKDKDYRQMLDYLIPLAGDVITFTPQNARGLDGEILKDTIEVYCDYHKVRACKDVNAALKLALSEARKEDVVVVCGSLSFMEEMESCIWK